ncbi:MAG: thioredoxin fold domain-containing protein [Myxococcales bacterium]|nr:thioredoxin fold domain-containing protein [Myxococcales bacterium]
MLLLSTAAMAAPPTVTVAWKKDASTVAVAAPAGEKVSTEAPIALVLRSSLGELRIEGPGVVLHGPLPVPDLRGSDLEGELEVGLCTLDGSICRPTRWALAGHVSTANKGVTALVVSEPVEEEHRPFGPDADASGADQAFARAKTSGRAVLLDFSAVWCPPCNLLGTEVLHADPHPEELDAYEVAVLDADNRASFELKQRYDIGSYPTVLVVDADGAEKARMVGYPGREAMLGWLREAPASDDAAVVAAGPEAATPDQAAHVAYALVTQGDADEAGPWLARTEGATDGAELRLARLALGGTADDAAWIAEHAPDRALLAAMVADDLSESDPAAWRGLVEVAARVARGTEQADVLELTADQLPEGPEQRALYEGAAAVVTSALTGVPDEDKPWIGWLSHLHEAAGHPERAVRLLEDAVATWPDEPTFDLYLSPLLLRLDRPEEALASAERAVSLSWDDNALRAVAAKADALIDLGRAEEARTLAAAELEAQPAPEPGTNRRTERYRARLQKVVDGEQARGG